MIENLSNFDARGVKMMKSNKDNIKVIYSIPKKITISNFVNTFQMSVKLLFFGLSGATPSSHDSREWLVSHS